MGSTEAWLTGAGILHGDGQTWTPVDLGIPADGWIRLGTPVVLGSADIWVNGQMQTAPQQPRQGVLLQWNGQTWAHAEANLPPGFRVATLAGVYGQGGLWAVGTGSAHWDGRQWTRVPVPVTGTLLALTVAAAGDAWAAADVNGRGCDNQILHWTGHAWQIVPTAGPANPGSQVYSLAVEAPGDVWAVGEGITPSKDWAATAGLVAHIFSRCATPAGRGADPHTPGVTYFPATGIPCGARSGFTGKRTAAWRSSAIPSRRSTWSAPRMVRCIECSTSSGTALSIIRNI